MKFGCHSSVARKIRSSRRGRTAAYSLIEVLMAAAIVALVFAALFAGIRATYSLQGITREDLRATQIIVSRMEGLRLCAWGSDQLFNTNVVPPAYNDWFYPLGLKSGTNLGTAYTGAITVTTNFTLNPPATYADKLALVTVTINWTNDLGSTTRAHTRSMNTYIAQYGVQNYIYGH